MTMNYDNFILSLTSERWVYGSNSVPVLIASYNNAYPRLVAATCRLQELLNGNFNTRFSKCSVISSTATDGPYIE